MPPFQHFFAFLCSTNAKIHYICSRKRPKWCFPGVIIEVIIGSKKERKEKTMKALDFLVAFVGGAAVGAACGLLFAPEKGSELREKIAEALRKRGIKLNRKEMSELVDEIAEELQAAKEEE